MGIINLLPFYRWGFEILKEFWVELKKNVFFAKTPGLEQIFWDFSSRTLHNINNKWMCISQSKKIIGKDDDCLNKHDWRDKSFTLQVFLAFLTFIFTQNLELIHINFTLFNHLTSKKYSCCQLGCPPESHAISVNMGVSQCLFQYSLQYYNSRRKENSYSYLR